MKSLILAILLVVMYCFNEASGQIVTVNQPCYIVQNVPVVYYVPYVSTIQIQYITYVPIVYENRVVYYYYYPYFVPYRY